MSRPCHLLVARVLTLVAALPWSAIATDARCATPDRGVPMLAAPGDNAATITVVLTERKTSAKGERTGTGVAVVPAGFTPTDLCMVESCVPRQVIHTSRTSCAFLCRLLV
ncbi:MAG: hypothetical protein JXO22_14575 [Phycisphaerae bacterium]|nr:hypothetical protein [Phycisphaerae bacterium]